MWAFTLLSSLVSMKDTGLGNIKLDKEQIMVFSQDQNDFLNYFGFQGEQECMCSDVVMPSNAWR